MLRIALIIALFSGLAAVTISDAVAVPAAAPAPVKVHLDKGSSQLKPLRWQKMKRQSLVKADRLKLKRGSADYRSTRVVPAKPSLSKKRMAKRVRRR